MEISPAYNTDDHTRDLHCLRCDGETREERPLDPCPAEDLGVVHRAPAADIREAHNQEC